MQEQQRTVIVVATGLVLAVLAVAINRDLADELRTAARRERFRDSAYSLVGGLPPETYVLAIVEGGSSVYYTERGERADAIESVRGPGVAVPRDDRPDFDGGSSLGRLHDG